MKLIIRNATIVSPGHKSHLKIQDIVVEDGVLVAISDRAESAGHQEIDQPGLHVSAGWFDSSVSFGEPGFEERGGIANGLDAAAAGGFTDVALQPDTHPVIDNQSQVLFARQKVTHAVGLHPIGALTRKMEGQDLAELYDMHLAGAIGFGDYKRNIDNANLMKIALQYTQDFGGLVIAHSQDSTIAGKGVVHEGPAAMRLGLKAIAPLAEELMVARNLQLLEYAGGRLHIPCLSTPGAIGRIREAKAKGLAVTCSASVHHLVLTDEALSEFDSNAKVSPPLRDEAIRKQLVEAVLDGTIDAVTSDHRAIDIEHKKLEFDLAMDGTIGLESALGALLTVLPLEVAVEKLTAARDIFKIDGRGITIGKPANLTLFDPSATWTFGREHIISKSKNSAFEGCRMQGRVVGIVARQHVIIN